MENNQNNLLPEIVSINQLCSLMSISRSRFYQLLNVGILLPPIYSTDTKRPYFTKEMAQRNLDVKKNNVGVNGRVCIFYNTRSSHIDKPQIIKSSGWKKDTANNPYTDLIEGLNSLGLKDVKSSQVESAVKKCFPDGINNVDEGEVLREVFCLISEQNSNDNLNR